MKKNTKLDERVTDSEIKISLRFFKRTNSWYIFRICNIGVGTKIVDKNEFKFGN